jgi:uncharacterized membrane-anchored protein
MRKHMFFSLAVLAQVLILLVKPTEKLIIRHVTGQVVTLETKPVDPYDVFRGYYMVLSYVASQPEGFRLEAYEPNEVVYTLLRKDESGVWQPVSVLRKCPADLDVGQAVIRGRVSADRWRRNIVYGIEEFYVPENTRHRIESEAWDARRSGAGKSRVLVDIAVDAQGRSSLLRLHIGDKTYEY